jgi:flagellar motor protein MotB
MRRRAHAEEHENHERWLVSYADFITLLFAFFVVMYSLSTVNEGKYRVLSDSLVTAFRNVNVNTRGQQIAPGANAPRRRRPCRRSGRGRRLSGPAARGSSASARPARRCGRWPRTSWGCWRRW